MSINYENYIDELIDRKLKEALSGLGERAAAVDEQTAAALDAVRQSRESEIRGAYGDYMKQIDPYGVTGELTAARGLAGAGKSETAKVGYYNVYQNALADIRRRAGDAEQVIRASAEEEKNALADAGTKARTDAYNSLLEEYIRRSKEQETAQRDARDYAYKLAQAEQDQINWERNYALKEGASGGARRVAMPEDSANGDASEFPAGGSAREKYDWFYYRLSRLSRLNDGESALETETLLTQARYYLAAADYRELERLFA